MSTRRYLSEYEKLQKKKEKNWKKKLNLKNDLWINMLLVLKKNSNLLEELKYKNLISNFASQKARKIDFK